MIIRAQGLAHSYGATPVFSGVDLDIRSGEVVSIVGPNGAGKTTLLRCLSGMLQPKVGEVLVDGRPIGALSRLDLADRIAYVPQSEPSRFPVTAFDMVLLGRRRYLGWRPRESDLTAAANAIGAMGLDRLALREMNQLSGGERQKVAIARALAQEAPAVLLDEPTTYLDLRHQLLVMDVLAGLAQDPGTAVVMTVHDLNLALRISDRIVVLHDEKMHETTPAGVDGGLIEEVWGTKCEIVEVDGRPVVVAFDPLPERAAG